MKEYEISHLAPVCENYEKSAVTAKILTVDKGQCINNP